MNFHSLVAVALAGCVSAAMATTLGPIRIIQCPGSAQVIKQPTLASANTYNARSWSDGYVDYPMLPDQPLLTRCDDQGKWFWVRDAKVVGEFNAWEEEKIVRPEWRNALTMRTLLEDDYLAALAAGMGRSREEAGYLRIRAWWSANDAARNSAERATSPFLPGSRSRGNLESLVKLFDNDKPAERLMKAEALRELGRLDEAREILQTKFPAGLADRVRWILELVDKRDTLVREAPRSAKQVRD